MAKYRNKLVVIDAEKYKKGMEDGFENIRVSDLREDNIKVAHAWYGDVIKDKTANITLPYISILGDKEYIGPNDMIVTQCGGNRYICNKDIFEKTHEKIESDGVSEILSLRNLCKPIFEYINEHYDPYTQIIITDKQVKITKDEIGIPMQN